MIPKPPVSHVPSKAGSPRWRSSLGTGLVMSFLVFCVLAGTWIARHAICSQTACKPDTSLLGPLIAAGPVAWLIASLIAGTLAMAVHAAIRWRRFMA